MPRLRCKSWHQRHCLSAKASHLECLHSLRRQAACGQACMQPHKVQHLAFAAIAARRASWDMRQRSPPCSRPAYSQSTDACSGALARGRAPCAARAGARGAAREGPAARAGTACASCHTTRTRTWCSARRARTGSTRAASAARRRRWSRRPASAAPSASRCRPAEPRLRRIGCMQRTLSQRPAPAAAGASRRRARVTCACAGQLTG